MGTGSEIACFIEGRSWVAGHQSALPAITGWLDDVDNHLCRWRGPAGHGCRDDLCVRRRPGRSAISLGSLKDTVKAVKVGGAEATARGMSRMAPSGPSL